MLHDTQGRTRIRMGMGRRRSPHSPHAAPKNGSGSAPGTYGDLPAAVPIVPTETPTRASDETGRGGKSDLKLRKPPRQRSHRSSPRTRAYRLGRNNPRDPRDPEEALLAVASEKLRQGGHDESIILRWVELRRAGHYRMARLLLSKDRRLGLCGAVRKRDRLPCIAAPVPGKKRCRFHGGLSTGPRTSEGLARCVAANRRRGELRRLELELSQLEPDEPVPDGAHGE